MVGVFLVAAGVTVVGRAAVARCCDRARATAPARRHGGAASRVPSRGVRPTGRRHPRATASRRDAAAAAGARATHRAAPGRRSGASPGRRRARATIAEPGRALAAALADPEAPHLGRRHGARRTTRSTRSASCLDLHPLIAEDIARAQPAGEDRVDGRRHPRRPVRDRATRARSTRREVDFVLGDRFLLTVHEPGWDPCARTSCAAARAPCSSAARTSCSGRSPTAIVDGYFPCLDGIGDEIDDAPGRGHRARRPVDARSGCSRSSASSSGCAGRSTPGPRGVQPAHEPRPAADRRRARRLLPRRVRPPDPGHRRARQLPRAGRRARSRSTSRRSTTTCRRS